MYEPYHQDERDNIVGIGCLLMIAILFIGIITFTIFKLSVQPSNSQPQMDGSTAGANAVTLEEIELTEGQ